MTEYEVTDDAVEAFTRKLDDFAQGLSPLEQNLLATVVAGAAAGEGDVEAHFFDIGPIIADPTVHLAHAYAVVAWHTVQPHLQAIVQHALSSAPTGPHTLPHHPLPR